MLMLYYTTLMKSFQYGPDCFLLMSIIELGGNGGGRRGKKGKERLEVEKLQEEKTQIM